MGKIKKEVFFVLLFSIFLISFTSALNVNIPITDTSTTYYPTSFSIVSGTASGNNDLGNLSYYDLQYFNITEVGGTGFDLRINYTNVTDVDYILKRAQYDGNGNNVILYLWDYDAGIWESYGTIASQPSQEVSQTAVLDADEHIQNGLVQLRLSQLAGGNPLYKYIIDYVQLQKGSVVLESTNEHDSLSGRNSPTNHPWAVPYTYLSNYVPYTGATGDVDLGSNKLTADSLNITQGDYSIYSDIFDWTGLGALEVIELVGEIGTVYFRNGITIRGVDNFAKITYADSLDDVGNMGTATTTYYPSALGDYSADSLVFTDASGGYYFDNNLTTTGTGTIGNLDVDNISINGQQITSSGTRLDLSSTNIRFSNTAGTIQMSMENDVNNAIVFQYSSGQGTTFSMIPGAGRDMYFYQNAANGENPVVRFYGYPTGLSSKYGEMSIINSGGVPAFQIKTTSGIIDFDNEDLQTTGTGTFGNLTSNGGVGITKTVTVRDSAGTGTCTLIFTGGLYTGGTC